MRSDAIPSHASLAGGFPEGQAASGERDTEQRHGVLEHHGPQRGFRVVDQEADRAAPRMPRFRPKLPRGPHQGAALDDEGDAQDHVRPGRPAGPGRPGHQHLDALEDCETGAEDEDADGSEQRSMP
jgi:hypothetical protein